MSKTRETKVRLTLRVPRPVHKQLKADAKLMGLSLTAFITLLLRNPRP